MNLSQRSVLFSILVLFLTGILVGCNTTPNTPPTITETAPPTETPDEVILTMGAWRTSTEGMNDILNAFHEIYPHITIRWEPALSGEYDAILDAQLEAGTAPDLFYIRSFDAGQQLAKEGYLEPLGELPGLHENFSPERLSPWGTEDNTPYGVPLTASSHGIYYNKDIFEKLGLHIPETWEELLAAAQVIKDAGYIPFANGSKDAWTTPEIVFMNLAPNFVGGREGRMAYLNGDRCFNDANMVSAFQAIADLAPLFPPNHELLGYVDSLELFVQGKAIMWMSGSWDIPFLENAGTDFTWSIFAVPPPAGQPTYITFHPDVAIGLNAASQHKEEAMLFLEWMTSPAFGALLGDKIPGFFPMHRNPPTLSNEHANSFLSLHQGRATDIRFSWEKLGDGTPSGYALIGEGASAILQGEKTPQEATDALQAGLSQWFKPAMECNQ